MNMRPDPTFHASPKLAMEAPPENFAYTVLAQPGLLKARCACGDRRETRFTDIQPDRPHCNDAL